MKNSSIDINLTVNGLLSFIKKLNDTGDCINWTGSLNRGGYGQMSCMGISYRAHRVAYFLHHGNIDNNMVIDHLCKNRKCCNPHHLRQVTQKVNARENTDSVKTHCKHGHEFTIENTFIHKDGKYTHKKCRICTNKRNRIYRENKQNG